MTTAWHPAGDRELRVGLAGLGSMGRNHLRVISSREGVKLAAVADPVAEVLSAATAGSPAEGFADPLAMIREADLDGVVIAAPTNAHLALALAAIERGIAVLVEKPLAATVDEALQIVHAARARGVPVQVGHVERFNPAVLELGRLLQAGWLTTVYAIVSRRAGPFPARIRDVGVTIDLATHDVDILSWIAGERPTRVYAELAQRIHADHEDLLFGLLHFPSGAIGHARRQLADAGQAAPAGRRRRGGDVRARLPDPAPDLHPLGHRPPDAHRRLRADVQGRGRRAAGPERASRSAPSSTPSPRSSATVGRPTSAPSTGPGPSRSPAASSRRARTAGRWTSPRSRQGWNPNDDHHPAHPHGTEPPRRLDRRPGQPVPPRGAAIRLAVDRRDRHRRHGRGGRRRQDGPAAGGAVRRPRLAGHRGRRQRGGRRRHQRGPVARRRGAGPGRIGRRGPRGGPAPGHDRRDRGGPRGRRRRAHRPGHARRRRTSPTTGTWTRPWRPSGPGSIPAHWSSSRPRCRSATPADRYRARASRRPAGSPSRRTCSSPSRRSGSSPAPSSGTWRPIRSSSAGSAPRRRPGRRRSTRPPRRRGRGHELRRGGRVLEARRHDLPRRQHRARQRVRPLRRPGGRGHPRGHRGGEQPAVQPHPPAGDRRRRPLHPGLPALPAVAAPRS